MTIQKYFVSRIQADVRNLRRTIEDALAYFEGAFVEMDDSTRLELKVVLNELLVNAIKHGARNDDACYVRIIAGMTEEDCALLIVEDDGDGYDTAKMNIPCTLPPIAGRLEDVNETGRGIYIVKNLCDDFMVNEKGNKVVINKRLRKTLTA